MLGRVRVGELINVAFDRNNTFDGKYSIIFVREVC